MCDCVFRHFTEFALWPDDVLIEVLSRARMDDKVMGHKPLRARVTQAEAEREMVRQVQRAASDEALGKAVGRMGR